MSEHAMTIPNEAGWPRSPLKTVCELIRRGTAPSYVDESAVSAIGQRCVTQSGFDPSFARPHDERRVRGTLQPRIGDVLLNSTGTGTIGRSCTFDGDDRFIVDGHVTVLRTETSVADGRWIEALVRSPWGQTYLAARCFSGSTNQVELSRSQLASTAIPMPAIEEQRRIAEILDTVDEAIHSTERLIAKLEQVKQGVLHDLLTGGIDESGQLRDPIAHPDRFVESPLGSISTSFTLRRVGELLGCRPKNGHSPLEADKWTGTWMLGLGCLTPSGFVPRQLKAAPQNEAALIPTLLRDGDLLMSRSNTRDMVGLVGRYRDVGAPCTYPDLMMRLVPNETVSAAFLELALRAYSSRRQIQSIASGTSGSMVKIGSTAVMGLLVPVPDKQEQERIVTAFMAFEDSIARETGGLAKLRALKDGLMNDLLTGRVRVTVNESAA